MRRAIMSMDLRRRLSHEVHAHIEVLLDGGLAALQSGKIDCKGLYSQCLEKVSTARDAARGETASRACVLILMGTPGAGKTEVAKLLEMALGADRVRRDDDMFDGPSGGALFEATCRAKMEQRHGVLNTRKPLIIDKTNSTAEARALAHELAAEHESMVFVVRVTAPEDTCVTRLKARGDMGDAVCRLAVRSAAKSLREQPLDEDHIIQNYQGYEEVFIVDNSQDRPALAERVRDVASEILARTRRATDTMEEFGSAPPGAFEDLPTIEEAESDGTAHLRRVVSASAGAFDAQRLPELLGPGILNCGSVDELRRRAMEVLGLPDALAPRPLGPKKLWTLFAKLVKRVPDSEVDKLIRAWDHRLILPLAALRGARNVSPMVGALPMRDALVTALDSEDAELADAARRHLNWEAFLLLAMPEVGMSTSAFQGFAPGATIPGHNDRAAFDYRFIQQYAEADAEFVVRFDIARAS